EAIRAGRADVVVAAGVDATGDALAEWLAATGGAYGAPPAEAGAAVVLERTGRGGRGPRGRHRRGLRRRRRRSRGDRAGRVRGAASAGVARGPGARRRARRA